MALRDIWADYAGAWAETDPAKRVETLRRTVHGGFVYIDPHIRTDGHDQLSHYIGALQKSIPGMRIVTDAFDEHHESCLVKWTMQDSHGKALAAGVTCGERAPEGLLAKASVFYGSPAS